MIPAKSERIRCLMLISSLHAVTWNIELDLVPLEDVVLSGLGPLV